MAHKVTTSEIRIYEVNGKIYLKESDWRYMCQTPPKTSSGKPFTFENINFMDTAMPFRVVPDKTSYREMENYSGTEINKKVA